MVDVSNALEELGSHGALGTGDGADEAASALPVLTHHQTAVAKSVGLAVDAVLEEAVVGKGAEGLVAVPAEREASGEGFAGSGGSTLAEALNGQSACAALEGLTGHKGVLGLDAAERTLLAVVLVALTTPLAHARWAEVVVAVGMLSKHLEHLEANATGLWVGSGLGLWDGSRRFDSRERCCLGRQRVGAGYIFPVLCRLARCRLWSSYIHPSLVTLASMRLELWSTSRQRLRSVGAWRVFGSLGRETTAGSCGSRWR